MRVLVVAATVFGLSLTAHAETPAPRTASAVQPVMHYRGLEKLLRRFAEEAKRGKVVYAETRTRG